MTDVTAEETTKPKTDTRRSKAYAAASVRLRQAHREEFNKYYAEECVNQGLVYKKRKSREEREAEKNAESLRKAQETVLAIQEKFGAEALFVAAQAQ